VSNLESFPTEPSTRCTKQTDCVSHASSFVVIADLPDLTKSPQFRARPSPTVTANRLAAFNRVIEKQANAFNIPIVRLSREPIGDDLVSEIDGFHPSDKGHRQIAQLFLKVILPRFAV
jgi:lysophospholipase L1-like esterase